MAGKSESAHIIHEASNAKVPESEPIWWFDVRSTCPQNSFGWRSRLFVLAISCYFPWKCATSVFNQRACLAIGAFPICPFVSVSNVISQLFCVYQNRTYLLDKRPHCGQCQPLLKTNVVVTSSFTSVGGGGGQSDGKSAARAGIDRNSRKLAWYTNASPGDPPCFNVKKAVHSGFRHIQPCWYTCGAGNLQCSHLLYIWPVVNALYKICTRLLPDLIS